MTETDFSFPTEARRKAEDILVKNKKQYFIQVFSGVNHGFAVKGDISVPDIRECNLLGKDSRFLDDWFRMGERGIG